MANKKVSQLTSKPSVLVTDLFPIADPSTGQLYKTTISDLGTAIGSGVSSVNGLVGAVVLDTDDIQELVSPTNKWFTDTRARAALSASSPLAYNSGTGVFSISAATSSQNGYLTSTDWTTFNSKQAALSGTGFVKISGTTISYDNSTYLTTSAAASTYLALSGGTLTGALNGTSATFTGDLTISSANPRLYFTDTDNNPDYFISNTDGTFTVYDVTNSTSRFIIGTTGNGTFGGNLTVGSIIKSGGTSSQFLKADGSVDSTAYLPLAGGTLTGALFGASASFSGFVGFGGNTSPLAAIDVTGAGIFSSSVTATRLILSGGTSPTGLYFGHTDKVVLANYTTGGGIDFETNGGNITMQLSSAGNLSTTGSISGTSSTFSGLITSNVTQSNTIGSGTNFSSPSGYWTIRTGVSNDFNIDTFNGGAPVNAFKIAQSGAATFSSSVNVNQLSINTTATNYKLHVVTTAVAGRQDMTNINRTAANMIRFTNPQYSVEASMGILLRVFPDSDARQGAGIIASGGSLNGETDLDLFVSKDLTTSNSYSALSIKGGSGNVGIGTTAPGNPLTVSSTIAYGAEFYRNNNADSRITINNTTTGSGGGVGFMLGEIGLDSYLWNYANGAMLFGTYGNERMRITSGGEVLVGMTSSTGASTTSVRAGLISGQRTDSGDAVFQAWNQATSGDNRFMDFYTEGSGTYTFRGRIDYNRAAGLVRYNVTSDYRLKTDLQDFNGNQIIDSIKVYDYKLKESGARVYGVMAHELQEVLPYAVTGIKDGAEMQGVDYSKIVPVMVQAIKELKAKIETLENK
jgi:hypothetical protein